MTGTWDSNEARRLRAFELISGTDSPVIPVSDTVLRVHSQSGRGYYTVKRTAKGWICDCASFEAGASKTGSIPCKHTWVAKIWFAPTQYRQSTMGGGRTRPTYSQNWPAYDAAQQDEHLLFDPLLWSLVEDIPEPLRPVGRGGRPPIPLSTQLLVAVKKVHLGMSMRRARGLIRATNSGGGVLSAVPNYAVPSRLFNRPEAGRILLDLIHDLNSAGASHLHSNVCC